MVVAADAGGLVRAHLAVGIQSKSAGLRRKSLLVASHLVQCFLPRLCCVVLCDLLAVRDRDKGQGLGWLGGGDREGLNESVGGSERHGELIILHIRVGNINFLST